MSFTVRRISETKRKRTLSLAKFLAIGLAVSGPLLDWYGVWKRRNESLKRRNTRVNFLKRFLLVLIAVLFALLLFTSIAKALMSVRGISLDSVIGIAGVELQTDENGFTNLLLLGQGHEDHDGKDLTDTIIVASIDADNSQSVALLSLPRDLYFLNTEKMGEGRLNSFFRDYRGFLQYERGFDRASATEEALRELGTEVGRKLNLDVHYVVKVDFVAFQKAVDAVGGIDLDVPYDINDQEYPDDNFGYEPFVLKAGMRHLDGETALKYVRSRNTSSDFGRSARQQQVLRVLGQKAKEEGVLSDPSTIASLMRVLTEHVDTTMSLREIVSLADLGRSIDQNRVLTMQLNDRNALYDYIIEPGGFLYTPPRDFFDGASIFLPVSIPELPVTWKQIQTLSQLFFANRTPYLAAPEIAVLNAGAPEGTARRVGNELTRYGFSVVDIANADIPKLETSLLAEVVPEGEDTAPLGEFFSDLLQIPLSSIPTNLPPSQRKRITIILGRDYLYQPLQNLLTPPTP